LSGRQLCGEVTSPARESEEDTIPATIPVTAATASSRLGGQPFRKNRRTVYRDDISGRDAHA
jgi:hypothetical protein